MALLLLYSFCTYNYSKSIVKSAVIRKEITLFVSVSILKNNILTKFHFLVLLRICFSTTTVKLIKFKFIRSWETNSPCFMVILLVNDSANTLLAIRTRSGKYRSSWGTRRKFSFYLTAVRPMRKFAWRPFAFEKASVQNLWYIHQVLQTHESPRFDNNMNKCFHQSLLFL